MNFDIFDGIDTVYITGHRNPDADSIVSARSGKVYINAGGGGVYAAPTGARH